MKFFFLEKNYTERLRLWWPQWSLSIKQHSNSIDDRKHWIFVCCTKLKWHFFLQKLRKQFLIIIIIIVFDCDSVCLCGLEEEEDKVGNPNTHCNIIVFVWSTAKVSSGFFFNNSKLSLLDNDWKRYSVSLFCFVLLFLIIITKMMFFSTCP